MIQYSKTNKKRVAIVQSNYIPWRGYFDLLASVDEFIIFDDMQYTRRDWRNRNKIKTSQGLQWLTIPVEVKGKFTQKIKETKISNPNWGADHWKAIECNYSRATYFSLFENEIKKLLLGSEEKFLADINRTFIKWVCHYLGIKTKISNSSEYEIVEGKTERLLSLCQQSNAHEYVSGPAAKSYLNVDLFQQAGISVSWFDYSGYGPYPQLWGDFEPEVSILDLIFNCGPSSGQYMKFGLK